MRVSAPRPRHTSHGEEKNTEDGKEASGDKTTESGTNEEENEGAEDEQTTGFVYWILKVEYSSCFSVVASRAAGQMVGGTFVPVCSKFSTVAHLVSNGFI